MTPEEKICPFMSRPHRPTNEILTSEDWSRIEEIGPNGIYLDGVVPCQRERCMAWVDEKIDFCASWGNCKGKKYLGKQCKEKCLHDGTFVVKLSGSCRLIERGA